MSENVITLGDKNGCSILASILIQNRTNEILVERVCSAINNMAHKNKLNASKFGSLGVIQEMIVDLRLYCHNLTIAYWFL